MTQGKAQSPERQQTDESLRVEREKADDTLEELAAIDDAADAVIVKARARADEVLAAARERTDRRASAPSRVIQRERALEDEAVADERAVADEVLRVERADHVALLSVERTETDKDLLSERAKADHAVATRDDFLAIVSHDLRNMLSTMIGFAGLIEQRVSEPDHVDHVVTHARRIKRAGTRMSRLVGDLVDVASIEAGQLTVTPEPSDASHVVSEAVDNLHAEGSARGISLKTNTMTAPLPADFDSARILQVLANVIGNAFKFTPHGGAIVAGAERIGDEIVFAVSDTGMGIPPDKLEAVFDRFLQVGTKDRRGRGLGLYISRCIVQGHGGKMWAESALGVGTTFRFTIPVKGV